MRAASLFLLLLAGPYGGLIGRSCSNFMGFPARTDLFLLLRQQRSSPTLHTDPA